MLASELAGGAMPDRGSGAQSAGADYVIGPSGRRAHSLSASFDEPDDTVTFDHGRVNLLKFGSLAIGQEVLEPGWRWSVHVKPIAGTERCEFRHVSFLLEGRIGVESRDGEIREFTAGEVVDIAPGHDAWVVGEQPAVTIDFQGVLGCRRRSAESGCSPRCYSPISWDPPRWRHASAIDRGGRS